MKARSSAWRKVASRRWRTAVIEDETVVSKNKLLQLPRRGCRESCSMELRLTSRNIRKLGQSEVPSKHRSRQRVAESRRRQSSQKGRQSRFQKRAKTKEISSPRAKIAKARDGEMQHLLGATLTHQAQDDVHNSICDQWYKSALGSWAKRGNCGNQGNRSNWAASASLASPPDNANPTLLSPSTQPNHPLLHRV